MSDFKITDKNGIRLKTANTYVTEDLAVTLTDNDINNIVPENIAKNVTILGVAGTFEGNPKPEQTKTVEFNPGSANNITVTPDAGYVLSSAQVNKPTTMIPGNIKSGVNIGGVVGTYVGVPSLPQYDVTLNVNTFVVNDGELHLSYYINEERTPVEFTDTTTINGVYCIKFQIVSSVTSEQTPIDISIRFFDDPMSSAIVYFDKYNINPIDTLAFDTANIFIGDNSTINIDITQG